MHHGVITGCPTAKRWQAALYNLFLTLLLIVGLNTGVRAQTWEEGPAHVAVMQSQYMPTLVSFTADTGTASCPAGTWLTYNNSNQASVQAVYAMLLAALNTGNKILYFITAGDTTCNVKILYEYPSP
jgi:hypothetical protein